MSADTVDGMQLSSGGRKERRMVRATTLTSHDRPSFAMAGRALLATMTGSAVSPCDVEPPLPRLPLLFVAFHTHDIVCIVG